MDKVKYPLPIILQLLRAQLSMVAATARMENSQELEKSIELFKTTVEKL
jgi:hypothetical protein